MVSITILCHLVLLVWVMLFQAYAAHGPDFRQGVLGKFPDLENPDLAWTLPNPTAIAHQSIAYNISSQSLTSADPFNVQQVANFSLSMLIKPPSTQQALQIRSSFSIFPGYVSHQNCPFTSTDLVKVTWNYAQSVSTMTILMDNEPCHSVITWPFVYNCQSLLCFDRVTSLEVYGLSLMVDDPSLQLVGEDLVTLDHPIPSWPTPPTSSNQTYYISEETPLLRIPVSELIHGSNVDLCTLSLVYSGTSLLLEVDPHITPLSTVTVHLVNSTSPLTVPSTILCAIPGYPPITSTLNITIVPTTYLSLLVPLTTSFDLGPIASLILPDTIPPEQVLYSLTSSSCVTPSVDLEISTPFPTTPSPYNWSSSRVAVAYTYPLSFDGYRAQTCEYTLSISFAPVNYYTILQLAIGLSVMNDYTFDSQSTSLFAVNFVVDSPPHIPLLTDGVATVAFGNSSHTRTTRFSQPFPNNQALASQLTLLGLPSLGRVETDQGVILPGARIPFPFYYRDDTRNGGDFFFGIAHMNGQLLSPPLPFKIDHALQFKEGINSTIVLDKSAPQQLLSLVPLGKLPDQLQLVIYASNVVYLHNNQTLVFDQNLPLSAEDFLTSILPNLYVQEGSLSYMLSITGSFTVSNRKLTYEVASIVRSSASAFGLKITTFPIMAIVGCVLGPILLLIIILVVWHCRKRYLEKKADALRKKQNEFFVHQVALMEQALTNNAQIRDNDNTLCGNDQVKTTTSIN